VCVCVLQGLCSSRAHRCAAPGAVPLQALCRPRGRTRAAPRPEKGARVCEAPGSRAACVCSQHAHTPVRAKTPPRQCTQVVKREVLERSTAELAAARSAADDARYELARHLNTVRAAPGAGPAARCAGASMCVDARRTSHTLCAGALDTALPPPPPGGGAEAACLPDAGCGRRRAAPGLLPAGREPAGPHGGAVLCRDGRE
jgi:hypothetical protein